MEPFGVAIKKVWISAVQNHIMGMIWETLPFSPTVYKIAQKTVSKSFLKAVP